MIMQVFKKTLFVVVCLVLVGDIILWFLLPSIPILPEGTKLVLALVTMLLFALFGTLYKSISRKNEKH
jgi:hypothetical protein